jgi:alpha-D-ribose 1-methylphosphonate 5-triphosphate synthase subunit PhnH
MYGGGIMRQSTLYETQTLFRILMNAMAAPGSVHDTGCSTDIPLVMRICETLIDIEVSFSVIGDRVDENLINEINLRTGAPYVDAQNASFVIVSGGSSDQALSNLNIGTLEYPEHGATVIYMATDLASGEGIPVQLSGPGIRVPFTSHVNGIQHGELTLLSNINKNYPLGIDTIFCDDRRVLALPRTTLLDLK